MTLGLPRLPIALAPLIAEAKRRTLLRRSLLGLALLVLAGGAVIVAFALRSSLGPGAPRPLTSSVHVGRLSVSIPRGFHVYTLRGGIYRSGTRPPVIGDVLTDFRLPAHTTVSQLLDRWTAPRGNGPPSKLVALELEEWWGIGGPGPHSLHLPLSLKQPWVQLHLANGSVAPRYQGFLLGTASYEVMYWSGPSAPANDRAAVLRALRSIRPTR